MHDVATLLQTAIALVIVTAPIIVLARVIAAGGRDEIGDPFMAPAAMPWPRGVQEADGPRWNVELARPRRSRPVAVPARPRGSRQAIGCGTVDVPGEAAS